MNFKARVRLILSRFKMTKGDYRLLEKLLENKDGSIYVFSDDGLLIATNKRRSLEEPIRATVRSAKIIDRYPRGIAVTAEGIKIMDDSMSDSFKEVMRAIDAFNREAYASRNEKARRINPSRRKDQSNGGADQG